MLYASLLAILLLILALPLAVSFVEKNLEVFLFVMGLLAVTLAHYLGPRPVWSRQLVAHALTQPVAISLAVLIAGLLMHRFQDAVRRFINRLERLTGKRMFFFIVIAALGLAASLITVIVAAIILVEVLSIRVTDERRRARLAVIGCFSIGIGAALTPIGEPLANIFVEKLSGPPYHAGTLFLLKHFGAYIMPAILLVSAASLLAGTEKAQPAQSPEKQEISVSRIVVRTLKVYIFIVALVLLGRGFMPMVETYVLQLSPEIIYWVNVSSAVIDNATLASAEIEPSMELAQLRMALMALLISGGMLIPGNIPNIISANQLGIGSKAWARFGIPMGLGLLVLYFALFLII